MNIVTLLKTFILFLLFLINIFLFLNLENLKNKKEFEIDFLDVGQGNGTLIKTQNLNILIDSGKELYARKTLYKNLSFFDRNLDLVFASHYDYDHVGNFLDYFQKYKISYFFRNGKESKAPIYSELLKLTKIKKIKTIDLKAGDILKINKNFYIKVLFPDRKINQNKMRDNDSSLVLQIFYKNKIFLITGDSPVKIERWLIEKYGDELKSDILLAGHHGSRTSSSEEFLKVVKPDLIIFSTCKNNSYHHPNKEILERVKKLGIKYLRTDEIGTVKYFFKNNEWSN